MKRHLPILVSRSVGATQAVRLDLASKFEMQTRQKMTESGSRVTCTVGCSSCCHHPIQVSIFEGILIYRWLTQNHKWTTRLKEKLKRVSDQQYGTSFEVWLLSNLPCPLLEDNKCSVYKARPLVCRAYFATSDPYYCHPHRLGAMTQIVPREEVVDVFNAQQETELRQHKLQFMTMPIGAAVLLGAQVCEEGLELSNLDRIIYQEYVEKG